MELCKLLPSNIKITVKTGVTSVVLIVFSVEE